MGLCNYKILSRGAKVAAVFGITLSVFFQFAVGDNVPELKGVVVPPGNIEVIPDSKLHALLPAWKSVL